MKNLTVFDLDGTLAKSKSPVETEMAELLGKLMGVMKVAVISGGAWPHSKSSCWPTCPRTTGCEQFSLLPTSGTKFFRYDGQWTQLYAENFTLDDKTRIIDRPEQGARQVRPSTGETLGRGDRGSRQPDHLSALGQEAPLGVKQTWDPEFEKRKKIRRSSLP